MSLGPDKGGGIVPLKKEDYIQEMNNLLADQNTYQILKKDATHSYKRSLEHLVSKGFKKGILNKK